MSAYRMPEWSDPRFTPEGLHLLTFRSAALGRRGSVTVYLPPEAASLASVPMVVLLHGVYNSHWGWAFKGGALDRLRGMMAEEDLPPCCLVMPEDGGWRDGTMYLNHHDMDVERWIIDDVPGCVAEHFDCLEARNPFFLAGFSMGGFGALHLAGKFPKRFRAVSAHSSMTRFDQIGGITDYPVADYGPIDPLDADPSLRLVEQVAHLPPLRFDCGVADTFVRENRILHATLTAAGVNHVYQEFPGEHGWDYWYDHLADTLRFFLTPPT